MSRPRLPHPPRTINQPHPCPTGRPRFATIHLARAALTSSSGDAALTAAECGLCGGAHHQPARKDPA